MTVGCVLVLLLLCGCSTKKNTLTNRMFHNLTSHFNIYWNGEKILKEGDKQLRDKVKDDYSKVLRVYNYGTQQDGMTMNSVMDRSIEKTAICVQKHSMKFGGRERVKWIDDAYLVMGKAHFYKHDYVPARRTFDFTATEFNYNNLAYVANLWLIKTYIETEEYSKALAQIEQLQAKTSGESKLPKEFQRNVDFVVADYYIAVKEYNNALKYLKNGLLLNNDRDLRTRVMFIIGQIYMIQGDSQRATAQFKKVIKRNPVYEMSFESKMNIAKVGSANNAKELYKMLNRMLDDANNEDYQDRIYYAMAELALREGDDSKAIKYLRESVAAFKDNQIQRMQSSLKVASMFFERNNYEMAQAYYDTAVTSMDKKYVGYDSIFNISQTLNELVLYSSIVHDQDSLLKLATMDSVSRNAIIDKIIAEIIEQERLEKEQRAYEEQLALMGTALNKADERTSEPSSNSSSAWYFYNQAAISKGITEFSRKWGMRKLEDNWRLSDKRALASLGDEKQEGGIVGKKPNPDGKQEGEETVRLTNHDRGYYLQNLPFKEEQKKEADSLIADALYSLGLLYMDRLSNLPRSIESYESLDSRYPGNKKELPSWYALYKMYNDLANEEKAQLYKGKIFDKYPNSSYAQFISDPDYFKKLQEQEKESSDFYDKTYEAFEQGQFYRVKMNTERAMKLYDADTAMMPRFAFLNAVALGRLVSVDSMAFALYDLVRSYPNSSITPYARRVLEDVNEEYHIGIVLSDMDKKGSDEPVVKKEAAYIYQPDIEHFAMIVCDSHQVRIDPLKVRISDFNKKEYRFKTLLIKSIVLDADHSIVTIGNFDNEKQAADYVTSMLLSDYVFGGIEGSQYSIVPISIKNYPLFYQAKDIDEYKQFMESNTKK